ncbi:MAG: class I SAM-dependent methyltransferase [Chitinophagia bacterium]|nr:class I SAM-dependent methyltransferase [Chitinophagia bacterium]
MELQDAFGNIDIYLFDQLLKGRFNDCTTVADLGCGGGRNSVYFLRNGYNVFAADSDPQAVAAVRELAYQLAPSLPDANFQVSALENVSFPPNTFCLVICSAVLHFARDQAHFEAMLTRAYQLLKPGGYLFARLASSIGIENLVQPLGNGQYLLPDGSTRFLVSHPMLEHYTQWLGAGLFEPIKTTNVSNLRCMTTWCLQKP